jgi:hypothetical protein
VNASKENEGAADDSVNQITQTLLNNLPEIDSLRATALDDLRLLRTARAAGLQSEHQRLIVERGADDPRVAEIAVTRANNEEFIKGLTIESERARVPVPAADKDTWILHGFVRDLQQLGVPNVTVALYDAAGNWIQQLGYAGTATNGYFRLEVRSLANLKSPLFVRVLTGRAAHLHTDNVPITPEAGTVLYHEVVITGEQTGTPPDDSRNDPVAEPGAWIVRGRVTDKKGKALKGLLVSLYDKDLFFDDKLGQTETDVNGDYSLTYRAEDFRDLIEKRPDIYVKVLDEKGNTIHTSKKKLRYEAGRIEIVNIEIEEPGEK